MRAMRPMRSVQRGRALALLLGLVAAVAAVLVAVVLHLNDVAGHDDGLTQDSGAGSRAGAGAVAQAGADAQRERGAYLAIAGNCAGCHTARGGLPYAGGRAIPTPFGTVFAGNLTPDTTTGIGQWSSGDFWRAMHVGRSRDGRLLYPAFPYTDYTRVSREDSDAIFAWLQTLAPVQQPNREHALRFPYGLQATLAVWRAFFFRPGSFEPDPARDASWNRGAYLVQGLGHCSACHAGRNAFGATTDARGLGGGMIPMQGWYAPSLASSAEAGTQRWPVQRTVELLRDGITEGASALGPMAEVVFHSTQHLSADDLAAIAHYLASIPDAAGTGTAAPAAATAGAPASAAAANAPNLLSPERAVRGDAIYRRHCADCHGDAGEGRPGMYPPLAGNRAVTMDIAANVLRVILVGGYPPGTAGNPRPYGMPPFATLLSNDEVADVASHIRNAWGNRARPVESREAARQRGSRVD
jgi:mono/diheme cytochrome c family protein